MPLAIAFTLLLIAHGAIHLMGFAKAFGLAELAGLTRPISHVFGLLWLGAALLFVAAAVALWLWPRSWWLVAMLAVGVSTLVIVPSWADARYGAIANALVLIGAIFGFLAHGPWGLLAAYERDVAAHRQPAAADIIDESDLAHLPPVVQRYLRVTGAVGQPRIANVRVRMHGRIRSGPAARWIPFSAEQYNFTSPRARLFYLTGSMFLVPVQGYHRYVGPSATMTIKAAALVPVASAAGVEMDRAETVTLFNDMCVMAPGTLIDPSIRWEPLGDRTVRGVFTNAGHTIRAELEFNDAGELIDFVSDDRYVVSGDGMPRQVRWSTPLREYRAYGPVRLASRGEGRWHEADGTYAYIELELDEIRSNLP